MRAQSIIGMTLLSFMVLSGCTEDPETIAVPVPTSSSSRSVAAVIASSAISSEPVEPSMNAGMFDPLTSAEKDDLPWRVSMDVPFAPQAPFANWDPPYDEACEEASLIIGEYALRGDALSPEIMDREIVAMVDWETQNGIPIDATTEQVATIAREYYKREAAVYSGDNVTIENIQALLNAGYPVIIPAAGQMLGNPYFSGDGPPYHMLVITGYEFGTFITNDPGTKRGEGYKYDEDVVMEAIHDWNGSIDTIRTGRKAMLVLGN